MRYDPIRFRPAIRLLCMLVVLLLRTPAVAQESVVIDLSGVDGVEITPANILNYRMLNQSGKMLNAAVTGTVQYRRSNLRFTYKYSVTLQPGINAIGPDQVRGLTWTWSSSGIQELFQLYRKLPQGTYEYCVVAAINETSSDKPLPSAEGCVYQTVEDIFLINLMEPQDKAKIYEYNPMLAWVVNYPFASELTYRLRVAELKSGQNPQNAIVRNNPVFMDNQVMSTGMLYPVTARKLEKFQPYVWTVDAYYKGILLGGSEVWRFTIIDDSEMKAIETDQSYYDFKFHNEDTRLNARGELRLKYFSDKIKDTFRVRLKSEDGVLMSIPQDMKAIPLDYGDNRIALVFYERVSMKHKKRYSVELENAEGIVYKVPFTYLNPQFKQQQ